MHVLIEHTAYNKIMAYAQVCDDEIGGLLKVTPSGQRNLRVSDAWLVPQEVTGGSIEFKPGYFEAHIKEMGWWGKPMPHLCMGIWHSHVNMGVFMSGIDEADLVRKYACRGYLLNLVVNKKREIYAQVDSMVGPENGKPDDYTLVTIKPDVKVIYSAELLASSKEEMEKNVTKAAIVKAGEFYNGSSVTVYETEFEKEYGDLHPAYKSYLKEQAKATAKPMLKGNGDKSKGGKVVELSNGRSYVRYDTKERCLVEVDTTTQKIIRKV